MKGGMELRDPESFLEMGAVLSGIVFLQRTAALVKIVFVKCSHCRTLRGSLRGPLCFCLLMIPHRIYHKGVMFGVNFVKEDKVV